MTTLRRFVASGRQRLAGEEPVAFTTVGMTQAMWSQGPVGWELDGTLSTEDPNRFAGRTISFCL